jgi:hypothetical protein
MRSDRRFLFWLIIVAGYGEYGEAEESLEYGHPDPEF